jgi:hypothetical protein
LTSIDALVKLAERSERLILHYQRDGVDSYLIDDEGTLYRYQARPEGERQPPAENGANRDGATAGPA